MDRKELIKKVATLTDNMNKKTRKFTNEGYGEFFKFTIDYNIEEFNGKVNLKTESGFLTKSKTELAKLNDRDLAQLYDNLSSVQTNQEYSTVKRFIDKKKIDIDKSTSTIKTLIGEDKYNKLKGNKSDVDFTIEFIKRKDEEIQKNGRAYASANVLNAMYMDLPNLTDEEKKSAQRTAQKMERGASLLRQNTVRMEGRTKNGNRRN